MGAAADLMPTSITVAPGETVTVQVRARNAGTVVDKFTLSVLGSPAHWTTVEPPVLSLFPGAEERATVIFAPPRSADTRAGELPFAVRVESAEDPLSTVVEEGTVWVGEFEDVTAELVPRTSQGRRRGRHQLAIDNRGNTSLNLRLSGRDPENRVRIRTKPTALVVAPDTTAFAAVRVEPYKRFWRGPNRTHQFQVLADATDHPPVVTEGAMVQEALIPSWLPKAALAAAVLALLLGIAWFAFLKPTVEQVAKDAAKEAVAEPLSAQQAQLDALEGKGDQQAEVLAAQAERVAAASTPPATVPPGVPFSKRLVGNTQPGATTSGNYAVPDNSQVSITDIVLGNPDADTGSVTLGRAAAGVDDADAEVLLDINLANFRDLDYHFVTPLIFSAGERIVLRVTCATAGPADAQPPPASHDRCTPSALLNGTVKT